MTPKMAKMAINAIYGVISDLENKQFEIRTGGEVFSGEWRQRYWAWCVHYDPVLCTLSYSLYTYTQVHNILYCTWNFVRGLRFN